MYPVAFVVTIPETRSAVTEQLLSNCCPIELTIHMVGAATALSLRIGSQRATSSMDFESFPGARRTLFQKAVGQGPE